MEFYEHFWGFWQSTRAGRAGILLQTQNNRFARLRCATKTSTSAVTTTTTTTDFVQDPVDFDCSAMAVDCASGCYVWLRLVDDMDDPHWWSIYI